MSSSVYKPNISFAIIGPFLAAPIFYKLLLQFNIVSPGFINIYFFSALFILLMLVVFYFWSKTVEVKEDELIISSRMGKKIIPWEEIKSLSSSIWTPEYRSVYKIHTQEGNFVIPYVKSRKKLIEEIIKHADLEIYFDKPYFKRYKRKGENYVNTGWEDSISVINGRYARLVIPITTIVLIIGIIVLAFWPWIFGYIK